MLLFHPSHVLVTVFLAFCLLATSTSASSAPRPLKRISHPTTLAIEIYPRTPTPPLAHHARDATISPDSTNLLHSDSFRLTLSAFGEIFHLHLRPNDQLVHPSARIVYYDTKADGQSVVSHTEPLLPSAIKAYWGDVVAAHASAERMRADAARAQYYHADDVLGWARITVHDQGDASAGRPPTFEGAFSVHGITYHVASRDSYLRNRRPLDPHPHRLGPTSAPDTALVLDLDSDADLVVWRESDVMDPWEEHAMRVGVPVDYALDRRSLVAEPEAVQCGHDALPWNSDPAFNPLLRRPGVSSWYDSLGFLGGVRNAFAGPPSKRDDFDGPSSGTNFSSSIGQTKGCPKQQQVLYMGVAADCEYVNHYGSQSNASKQILTIWNTASQLYKNTFNISLGIVELQIQNTTCPTVADPAVPWNVNCSAPNVDLDARLSLFSQWRGAKGNDGAGLWHLMSNCPTGSEVGIAWLGTLCQTTATNSGSSAVSGTAVSTAGLTEWQVISHEMGHNFGAIHDCADGCNGTTSCCPLTPNLNSCSANSKFLMSPVAVSGEMTFSPCSTGNICSLMQKSPAGAVNTSCLANPGEARVNITLGMCGNGIVESGEECDPGIGSNSTCCDVSTCKFLPGAICDPYSDLCCTAQCQFAPANQVCRAAIDPNCDTTEVCTGNSSACPADVVAPNGKSCGPNGLACASGQCTSITQQCQQLGTSLNLQAACPNRGNSTCQVSCQDPTSPNRCVILDTLLIDGSPCGYGGSCLNGTCQSGSILDTAEAWYVENLPISIPITVAAVLFTITIVWGLIGFCQSRRRRRDFNLMSQPTMQRLPSGTGPVSAPYPFTTRSATSGSNRRGPQG